jgi:hypothetical protein
MIGGYNGVVQSLFVSISYSKNLNLTMVTVSTVGDNNNRVQVKKNNYILKLQRDGYYKEIGNKTNF